jgi:DNA-binding response OmpR family regulator
MTSCLIVEDDVRVAAFIREGLAEKGFQVDVVHDGHEALKALADHAYEVVVLDIMMPGLDGFEVCQIARRRNIGSIIIILSALGDHEERIKGLEAGADDFMAKPFHFRELLARINAQLRRKQLERGFQTDDSYHDLRVDMARHQVFRAGREVKLTQREFDLLLFLMRNRERVLSRTEISEAVWDIHFSSNTNVVDVYISYLRNKIDKGHDHKLIHTVKGRGYQLIHRPDGP